MNFVCVCVVEQDVYHRAGDHGLVPSVSRNTRAAALEGRSSSQPPCLHGRDANTLSFNSCEGMARNWNSK